MAKLVVPVKTSRGTWKVGKHVCKTEREAKIQADLENRAWTPVPVKRGDVVEVWWSDTKPDKWLVTAVKKKWVYAVACVPSRYNNGNDTEEIEREQILRVVKNVKVLT